MRPVQCMKHAHAVEPGQEEIEKDEVVRVALCALEALATVERAAYLKALRLEPSSEESEDSRLVLDQQNPHRPPTLIEMT
jgi:hypothetical protein